MRDSEMRRAFATRASSLGSTAGGGAGAGAQASFDRAPEGDVAHAQTRPLGADDRAARRDSHDPRVDRLAVRHARDAGDEALHLLARPRDMKREALSGAR